MPAPPSPARVACGVGPRLVALGGWFQPNLAEAGGAGSLPGEGGEAAGWAQPLLDTGESSGSMQAGWGCRALLALIQHGRSRG